MPSITLNFQAPLNASCQVGDTAYSVPTSEIGGFTASTTAVGSTDVENTIIEVGSIREIDGAHTDSPTVIVESTLGYNDFGSTNSYNKFIFFSKDNKANLSSPSGYFASVRFKNDDNRYISELFSVTADVFGSSK